jgi:hypothetical protein
MTTFTREKFVELITREDEVGMHAIGRALVHLFKRQTEAEREVNTTAVHNMRGFTPADARVGSITAKYYIKNKKLLDWQIAQWLDANAKGRLRLEKYYRQIAEEVSAKSAK